MGDADGVVVIEREKAPAMMALADKKVADEAARIVADARTEQLVREADVAEGARAIGFTLGTPTVGMLGVVDDVSSPLRVVASIRSDFLDRASENRELLDRFTRGILFLRPLDQARRPTRATMTTVDSA